MRFLLCQVVVGIGAKPTISPFIDSGLHMAEGGIQVMHTFDFFYSSTEFVSSVFTI